jgi:hypothetical protein
MMTLAQQWGPEGVRKLAIWAGLQQPAAIDAPHKMSDNPMIRVRCVEIILDRAYGKPSQPMEHSVDEGLEDILERIGREAA